MLIALLTGALFAFIGALPVSGPVAVLIAERALSHRTREAVAMGVGAAVPEGIYATAACLGAEALLGRYPGLVPFAHGIGALFLVIVGAALLRGGPVGGPAAAPPPSLRSRAWLPDSVLGRAGATGALLVAVNPTLLVTWSAATAPLVGLGTLTAPGHAVAFGAGVCGGAAAGSTVLAAVLASQRRRIGPSGALLVRRAAGVLLLGFGVWLGWSALP